jgi:AcrR family transcriptional regulator
MRHSPTAPRSDAARNVQRILDAATSVLASQPDASMQEIAAAAGLNRGTLYRHFANRERLITEIQRAGLTEVQALFAGLPSRGPVIPALCDALAQGIALGARYRVVALAPRSDPDLLIDEAATALPLAAAVERGKQRGEIDPALDSIYIAALFAHTALATIGLVERAGFDEAVATENAQRTFAKAVALPQRR